MSVFRLANAPASLVFVNCSEELVEKCVQRGAHQVEFSKHPWAVVVAQPPGNYEGPDEPLAAIRHAEDNGAHVLSQDWAIKAARANLAAAKECMTAFHAARAAMEDVGDELLDQVETAQELVDVLESRCLSPTDDDDQHGGPVDSKPTASHKRRRGSEDDPEEQGIAMGSDFQLSVPSDESASGTDDGPPPTAQHHRFDDVEFLNLDHGASGHVLWSPQANKALSNLSRPHVKKTLLNAGWLTHSTKLQRIYQVGS
ncbi:uncharacterized protein EHS24_002223 [Apiotrichum porosum]|uniref:Uncharacterized protein n=1 Tax=Apiotrichum porosum TaxID=105984 RepID=A0A427XI23_9TREE|nr:uncharacterized protein EHS24_002223 [Apiotrichum porosum]RSH78498.1 hypothetical protein EHS24_002223 [Apiotrichum porosum]